MARRTLPLSTLRDALDMDDDEVPYDVEVRDDELIISTAERDNRPPEAGICGWRQDGYTLRATYRPESNDVLLKHTGPSIKRRVSLDNFRAMLRRKRVLSDLQYERALLYVNREWDRSVCDECGCLLTDRERDMLKVVAKDHPDKVSGPLCDAHQKSLYGVMEWNPWEDPEHHEPGEDNTFSAEEYGEMVENGEVEQC